MHDLDFVVVKSNGIRLKLAMAGDGPLVIFSHGWPESWYSWRHQIPVIAGAGYRAVAYDVRGYGESENPYPIEAYTIKQLAADVTGIIDALGYDEAILFGHDWGGPIALSTAVLYPQRISAVGSLSVPHTGRGPRPVLDHWRSVYREQFFYQLYFLKQGLAEQEFEQNLQRSLYLTYCNFDGRGVRANSSHRSLDLESIKRSDASFLAGMYEPETYPDWLTPDDLAYLVGQFENSGLRGPFNRYRAQNIDWYQLPQLSQPLEQPACFITGVLDPVNAFLFHGTPTRARIEKHYHDLVLFELLEDVGHWTQQEAPTAVNALLLKFLESVGAK